MFLFCFGLETVDRARKEPEVSNSTAPPLHSRELYKYQNISERDKTVKK